MKNRLHHLFPFCMALIGLWVLAACTPQEQYFNANAPLTPRISDTDIVVGDGTSLTMQRWLPGGKPEAVILGLHGFNDYSSAFASVGEYMQHHQIAVYAYDQRGFGSSGERGVWAGNHNLVRDVSHVLDALRKRYPRTPIYVMGESMGGAVAINAASINALEQADGVILAAPAIWGGDNMSVVYRVPLWIAAHIAPSQKVSGGDLELLPTDNLFLLRIMSRDPKVIKTTRLDAIYGLVNLMDIAYDNICKITMPTLVLYGAKDQIVPPAPFMDYAQELNTLSHHYFAYYPNGYHMITRDIHAYQVMEDIVSWIKDKDASLPSGADVDAAHWLEYDVERN